MKPELPISPSVWGRGGSRSLVVLKSLLTGRLSMYTKVGNTVMDLCAQLLHPAFSVVLKQI